MSGVGKLSTWTPRRAAKASRGRIDCMESMLDEIANFWGTADGVVADNCDRVKAELKNLRASVEYAGESANGWQLVPATEIST